MYIEQFTLSVSNLSTSVRWFPQINPNIASNEASEANTFTVTGLEIKKILSCHFATSYEKLVASSKILVANKHKLIIKRHINITNVGLQMINKALILLF